MLDEPPAVSYIEHAGETLAVTHIAPAREGRPGLFFLPGFGSDMSGGKAMHLAAMAKGQGLGFTSLDYQGHGRSSGRFVDGTLHRWIGDALDVLDRVAAGPQVIVGSSMGGWIALHLALARPERLHAVVGIAAAPDFTEELMWAGMDEAQRHQLDTTGQIPLPSEHGGPSAITLGLIQSGRQLLLLGQPIAIDRPVRLLQGMRDADVPWNTALRLAQALTSEDVRVILVKDGEHRLSRDSDLRLLEQTVGELLADA